MPEKSLPFFRQNPENQQNASGSKNIFGSGQNLVLQEEILPPHAFYLNAFAKFSRKLSMSIAVVFALMLVVNFYLNLKLESERKLINTLADEVGRYTLVRAEGIDTDKKSKFYQKTLSQRVVVGDKARAVFSNLTGPTVSLNTALVTSVDFNLTVEVATPREFADIISRYLESDLISSISIRSADLVASKNVFRVVLEGNFR